MRRSRYLDGTMLTARVARMGQRTFVRSVQYGTVTIPAGTATATATITDVDMSNALLLNLGDQGATGTPFLIDIPILVFTNSTTITANVPGGSPTSDTLTAFGVMEFYPGVFRSLQRGTINITNTNLTNTATITAVDVTKALLISLGSTNVSGSNRQDSARLSLTLTNATTITATRAGTTNTGRVSYQLAEYY